MQEHSVYTEEYEFIFSNKGSGVRKVMVLSALIEEQLFILTEQLFLRSSLQFPFKSNPNFYQILEILLINEVLTKEEADSIKAFRKERNKAVHGIFKGISRQSWDDLNKKVITLGRPIVEHLETKLYSPKSLYLL